MCNSVNGLTILTLLICFYVTNAHVSFLNSTNLTRTRRQSNCGDFSFQCSSGECIPDDQQCDGMINCKDGSDETFACRNFRCQPYLFRCAYGACINGDLECNGESNCKDNSDETSAKCKRETSTETPVSTCGPNQFRCNSGQCIEDLDVCDGIVNCNDGSDETFETCSLIACPGFTYKCAYGGCVDGKARCNGVKDCVDGSDEAGCGGVIITTTTKKPTTTTTTMKTPLTDPTACVIPEYPKYGSILVSGDSQGKFKPGDLIPSTGMINYKCRNRYRLSVDQETNYCINGKWIFDPNPTCEIHCESIDISNKLHAKCFKGDSEVSCEKPFSDTRAKLKCGPLYEDLSLLNNPFRYCKDGTWDRNLPNCQPECGIKFVNAQTLIIGGTIASKDHYPWQVGVYRKVNKEHICGGSIVSVRVVISAAHCFTDESGKAFPKENYSLAAGKHYRLYNEPNDTAAQYSEIKKMYIPNDYKGNIQNYRADIAILVLDTPFDLSNNVRPVCMDWARSFDVKPGATGVVVGWGLTQEGSKAADELKELEVPNIPIGKCTELLPPDFQSFATTGDKLCAGFLYNGTSVCQGDSGGGLVFRHNTRFYLRGIVSISPRSPSGSCDSNQYALYTKVSNYIDFISNVEEVYN